MSKLERPKFLPSFLGALQRRTKERGPVALIPFWFMGSIAAGAALCHFIPDSFWASSELDVTTTVYVGILTLNGLILALSWSAFSKIYDVLSYRLFSAYLRKSDLLNDYIVFIGFVHAFQVVAVLTSGAGLLIVLYDFDTTLYDRIGFSLIIGVSIYAIRLAVGAVHVMHDLLWQRSIFEDHLERQNQRNVVPFDRNGEEG